MVVKLFVLYLHYKQQIKNKMATTTLSVSGTTLKFYTKAEQNETLREFAEYDKIISSPNHIKYTTDKLELPYQLLNEVHPTYDTYIKTIKANNKTVVVKCNWKNEWVKTNKAVAKCFEI